MSSPRPRTDVPPALPDRYDLRIRLGRDGDLEEWLATDTVLDRAVLLRLLGPGASEDRRGAFLASVRGAAAVNHTHLAAVFAAGSLQNGAYAVLEWTGGVSLADRLAAGETLPPNEFLPNGAGLADALASLHARDVVHGAIDLGAISYTQAHPAKLGAYGRAPRSREPVEDVRALAEALTEATTGRPVGGGSPSQVTDGLPVAVDRALEAARRGELAASDLAARLRAIPSSAPPPPEPSWSWRWLVPASVLLALAVGFASLGLILRSPEERVSFLYPADPVATSAPALSTTTAPPTSPAPGDPRIIRAFAYDPFGDGREHDDRAPGALDDDPATTWRTERYFDPLPRIKDGVGLAFELEGSPGSLEFLATPGTTFSVLWVEEVPQDFGEWTRVASGTSGSGPSRVQLPARQGGVWLLWLENLPEHQDGFYTEISQVRFLP